MSNALFTFLTDDLRNSSHYKLIEADFMGGLRHGYISYNQTTAVVYKPILMAFLNCKQVSVRVNSFNESPDEGKIIDGTKYASTYVEGFILGCSIFQKYYEVSPDREYSDSYIKTIKDQFCDNGIIPWSGWYQPDHLGSIGYDEIKELGIRAGILSMVEQLASRNKAIRDAIAPCLYRKYSSLAEKYKPDIFKSQKAKKENNTKQEGDNESKKGENKIVIDKDLKLANYFEHISKYTKVMLLLVHKGHCQPNTYIWIDKGPGAKSILVGLIKHLHAQGFYRSNRLPTSKEIVVIAKNTFGVEISESTVKHSEITPYFDFINPGSAY